MSIEEFKAKFGHVGNLATFEEIVRAKVLADRRNDGEDYCALGCGNGPFPIKDMRVITSEEDPYVQLDDNEPVRICKNCAENNTDFADVLLIL